jgi:putative transposase
MARMARVVVSGYPHHVTQRGNRRQKTFFCDGDYQAYIELMSEWTKWCGVAIWAYCLVPNHIHLIAVIGRGLSVCHRGGPPALYPPFVKVVVT